MAEQKKRGPRPWWMINGMPEPWGDVYQDRWLREWPRMQGGEAKEGERQSEDGSKRA